MSNTNSTRILRMLRIYADVFDKQMCAMFDPTAFFV